MDLVLLLHGDFHAVILGIPLSLFYDGLLPPPTQPKTPDSLTLCLFSYVTTVIL